MKNKYEIVETVDHEFMILVHGLQWGSNRDKSGAGDTTFATRQAARMQLATLYMEGRDPGRRKAFGGTQQDHAGAIDTTLAHRAGKGY